MANNYAIITDITADMTEELRACFGLDGYMKSYMSTPEADEVEGRLEYSQEELDAFYKSLKANKDQYKTCAPSSEEMAIYFETFLREGRDLMVICISEKLSGTYNLMLNAKEMLMPKYPERTIVIIDSMKFSVAIGLLAVKACRLREAGYSINQNAEILNKAKRTLHQIGSLDDLFWVASKGRITHAKAFFGTLAGIKTMGDFDLNGLVTPIAKVSGYEKVYKAAILYMKKTIRNAGEQTIFVANTARRKQAELLAQRIRDEIKPKEVVVCNINPMSGINVGPGLVAAYYFGTEITDLKNEKEIIGEIVGNL